MDFFITHKGSVNANRHGGVRAGVEHIPHPQQRFRATLIENGAGVDFAGHGKCDTRRNVGFNQTGDDIHGRTLRRQHQVDTRRTRLLRETRNQLFDFFTDRHHQIGKLIHQHHDIRQFFQHRMGCIHAVTWFPVRIRDRAAHAFRFGDLLVITGKVTHAERRHELVTALHFIHAPAQRVGGVFHVGDHFGQKMWNAFIDRKFQHFRVDHNKAHIFRRRFIEHAQDHGVNAHRLTGTGSTRHQQVRHFRKIGHDRFTSDIFPQHHAQR